MLKHYIKFAFRNFKSNRIIFGGSLLTLCLGALCISLLFSYVYNELSMDNFHKWENDIYMVTTKTSPKTDWQYPYKFDSNEYPEIENATSIIHFREEELKFSYNENVFTPKGIVADSSFFNVLDFEMTTGNRSNILKDFEAVILTKKFSEKIFGKENPIGKEIVIIGRMGEDTHIVKGIVKMPVNSSLQFDYIIPNNGDRRKYSRASIPFFRAKKGFSRIDFNAKIENSNNNVPNFYPQLTDSKTKIVPLGDLYFDKDLTTLKKHSFLSAGNKENIYILLIIMLVVLFVSILNFSNLQIINTNSTVKNIAVSKINGAFFKHIIYRKITENIILIILAAILITGLYIIILPYFNNFVGVSLTPPIWKVFFINACILFLLTSIGLIYPTIITSRISITNSLKNQIRLTHNFADKKIIVVFQYVLTFVLLISSIVVARQLNLMLDKDLGFTSKNVIKTKLFYEPPFNWDSANWSQEKREEELKKMQEKPKYINNTLAMFSSIKEITQGASPLETFQIPWKLKKDNASEYESLNSLVTTPNYLKVFNLDILEGRFFDKNRDKEREHKIVINETAKKYWGIDNIETAQINNKVWGGDKNSHKIIGVVKDFNYEHLSAKPKPLVMLYFEDYERDYLIQFHDNQTKEGIQQVHNLFNEINPNQSFKYSFISNEITSLYDKEKRLSIIYIAFTIVALLISAIGLFTIALYDTKRRTKEIAVRKVNGAKVTEILSLLNKSFIRWVGVAFIIACPIVYVSMQKWLEGFAYKIAVSWWIFALAGVFTLVIALLTVSWQSYKAAMANPVKSLRAE